MLKFGTIELRVNQLNLKQKHSNALLLALMNALADFDGEVRDETTALLQELKQRSQTVPPLYADVILLPHSANCREFAERMMTLTQDQLAIASYAFQIFRFYEQILKANITDASPQQQAAYASQLERIRHSVMRTKAALAEAMGVKRQDPLQWLTMDYQTQPITMSSLDRQQSDRLLHLITSVEQLLTEVDEAGAEEILDELYLLITKLFERFPQLDQEEEE